MATGEVRNAEAMVAAELLLGFDIRTIQNLGLAVGDAYGGCGRNGLQPVGALPDAGFADC
jgi:hypothetical protein